MNALQLLRTVLAAAEPPVSDPDKWLRVRDALSDGVRKQGMIAFNVDSARVVMEHAFGKVVGVRIFDKHTPGAQENFYLSHKHVNGKFRVGLQLEGGREFHALAGIPSTIPEFIASLRVLAPKIASAQLKRLRAEAATEPTAGWSWDAFCQSMRNTRALTIRGVRYLFEVNPSAVVFIQEAEPAPSERELLSFRIMNGNLTLQSHGNYLYGINIYEVLRKYRTREALLAYLVSLVNRYAGGTTIAAAEPELTNFDSGLSFSAYMRAYMRFAAEAVADYQQEMRAGHRYWIPNEAGQRLFQCGIQYARSFHSGEAFLFSPSDYGAAVDHVTVGYYIVENLMESRVRVLRIDEGAVASTFTVKMPVLDHLSIKEFMANPVEGKRAFVGLRVNAILTAILQNIAKLRREAGCSGPQAQPVHFYDINDFHYRGSSYRPRNAQAAAEPETVNQLHGAGLAWWGDNKLKQLEPLRFQVCGVALCAFGAPTLGQHHVSIRLGEELSCPELRYFARTFTKLGRYIDVTYVKHASIVHNPGVLLGRVPESLIYSVRTERELLTRLCSIRVKNKPLLDRLLGQAKPQENP